MFDNKGNDTFSYKSILENINNAIICIDTKGIIKYINPSGLKLLKANHSSEITEQHYENFILKNQGCSKIDLYKNAKGNVGFFIKQINGHLMSVDAEFTCTQNNELIITIRNPSISKKDQRIRKLFTKEKEKRYKIMEDSKRKSYYYTNLSHELKTPINLIFGALQVLEIDKNNMKSPHPKIPLLKNIEIIKQNCLRMIRIINNMIDITRLEEGYINLNMQNINITSLLKEITSSASEYAQLKSINIVFTSDKEKQILFCDPSLIERIMLNLISNAIKFTDNQGTIRIDLKCSPSDIIITIKDSGIGIPEDKLITIFDRFEQVNSSLIKSHSGKGSGIGLNLVKEMVHLHNGEIKVYSEINKGAEFCIVLPLQTSPDTKILENHDIYDHRIDTFQIEMSDIYSGIK